MTLTPQLTRSQKVLIDQENKTVTLDEQKTIEIGKIVANEKRLKEENTNLLKIIENFKNELIRLADSNNAGLEKIEAQNAQIYTLAHKSQELSDEILKNEKSKKKQGRLFVNLQYEFNNPYFKSGNVGASFVTQKYSYGVSINPLNTQIIYGATVGISIF